MAAQIDSPMKNHDGLVKDSGSIKAEWGWGEASLSNVFAIWLSGYVIKMLKVRGIKKTSLPPFSVILTCIF